MGCGCSRVLPAQFFRLLRQPYHIVFIGLENSGKSTALYRFKFNQYVSTVATVGFNCEKVTARSGCAKGCSFVIWDVSGQPNLRPLWRSYLRKADAAVFIVDATASENFDEVKLELQNLLKTCSSSTPRKTRKTGFAAKKRKIQIPVLLVANKQDLPDACTEVELHNLLELPKFQQPIKTICACAVTGDGLDSLLDELYSSIKQNR